MNLCETYPSSLQSVSNIPGHPPFFQQPYIEQPRHSSLAIPSGPQLPQFIRPPAQDLLKLQTHSMKYNLIFEGLNETEGENTETVIKEFIKTELKIENEISFQNVHRLRKTQDRTPRAILARFTRYSDHDLVIKAVPENLRGKHYYKVYQQYPRDIADRRKGLYPKLREYRRQERRAQIVVDQLC